MVLATLGAEVVDVLEQPIGILWYAVLERWRAPRAVDGSFGRCPVVARDVDNDGVVAEAHCVDSINHALDLRIGVLEEASEDLHQTPSNRAVLLGVVLPRRNLFGARCERSVWGNDSEGNLAVVDVLAQFVPSAIECPAVLVAPLGRYVMRRVYRWR